MMLRLQQRLGEHFGVEIGSVKDGVQRWVHDTDVRRVVQKLEAELLED